MKLYNTFEDGIVIYGVICSGESINPATALPYNRDWNLPSSPVVVYNQTTYTIPSNLPSIGPREYFELKAYCFTDKGAGVGSLTRQDRFKGIIFINYRLNSSPSMFMHVIQGNVQGSPN
jgi:hypothetical protein